MKDVHKFSTKEDPDSLAIVAHLPLSSKHIFFGGKSE